MEYRQLGAAELEAPLFDGFDRTQQVTRCWRREKEGWIIRDIAFVDRWGATEIARLTKMLRRTAQTSGVVLGAFSGGVLKGFASVEGRRFGSAEQYLCLSCLHVSSEMRRNGIGMALFLQAADWAKAHGAAKLYISAHSAVESQAFYLAMGCADTLEEAAEHVLAEPFDRQMEFIL